MDVLGLQYFSCHRCGLVHSAVDEPARCVGCGGGDIAEIAAGRGCRAPGGDDAYFAGSMIDDR